MNAPGRLRMRMRRWQVQGVYTSVHYLEIANTRYQDLDTLWINGWISK